MVGGSVQVGDSSRVGTEAGDDVEVQVIQRRPGAPTSTTPVDAELSSLDGQPRQIPARRRRLARIVAAAIGSCALILLAAGVARITRSKPAAAATTDTASTTAGATWTSASATTTATATTTAAPTEAAQPATGNLVLVRPAVRGYVWLDGKKISTTSTAVACGPHQIKVGSFGHVHPIAVPCGGDLKVWR